LKKTNRERDYAIIGELARTVPDPAAQLMLSRSARDLAALQREHPDLASELASSRPVLATIREGTDRLEEALDAERRALIHGNEKRLRAYMTAAEAWAGMWPEVAETMKGQSFPEAHETMVSRAEGILPYKVEHDMRSP